MLPIITLQFILAISALPHGRYQDYRSVSKLENSLLSLQPVYVPQQKKDAEHFHKYYRKRRQTDEWTEEEIMEWNKMVYIIRTGELDSVIPPELKDHVSGEVRYSPQKVRKLFEQMQKNIQEQSLKLGDRAKTGNDFITANQDRYFEMLLNSTSKIIEIETRIEENKKKTTTTEISTTESITTERITNGEDAWENNAVIINEDTSFGTIRRLVQNGKLNNDLDPKIRNFILDETKTYTKLELENLKKTLEDNVHRNSLNYYNNILKLPGFPPVDFIPTQFVIISTIISTKILQKTNNKPSDTITDLVPSGKLDRILPTELKQLILGQSKFNIQEIEKIKLDFKEKVDEYLLDYYSGGDETDFSPEDITRIEKEISDFIDKQLPTNGTKVSNNLLDLVRSGKINNLLTPDLKSYLLNEQSFNKLQLENMQEILEKNLEKEILRYFNSFSDPEGEIPEYTDTDLNTFAEEIKEALKKDIDDTQNIISSTKISDNLLGLVKGGKIDNLLTPDLKSYLLNEKSFNKLQLENMQNVLEENLEKEILRYFNSFSDPEGEIPEYTDTDLNTFSEEIKEALKKDIDDTQNIISSTKISDNLLGLVKKGKIDNLLTPALKSYLLNEKSFNKLQLENMQNVLEENLEKEILRYFNSFSDPEGEIPEYTDTDLNTFAEEIKEALKKGIDDTQNITNSTKISNNLLSLVKGGKIENLLTPDLKSYLLNEKSFTKPELKNMQAVLKENLENEILRYFNSFSGGEVDVPEHTDEELNKFAEEIEELLKTDIESNQEPKKFGSVAISESENIPVNENVEEDFEIDLRIGHK